MQSCGGNGGQYGKLDNGGLMLFGGQKGGGCGGLLQGGSGLGGKLQGLLHLGQLLPKLNWLSNPKLFSLKNISLLKFNGLKV